MRRRSLLQSVTVGLAGLTGCVTFGDRPDTENPRLIGLTALNFDDEPHTFRVHIELDGKVVYRESKQVKAASPDDPIGAVFTGYPTEPNPYILHAWRNNRSKAQAQTLDFTEYDSKCLGAGVRVGAYGVETSNPRLAISRTTNCAAEQ